MSAPRWSAPCSPPAHGENETVVKWAGAAAAAAGAVGAYTLLEPLWLEVTRPRIHVRGLHPELEGFRIALLTDMHAGEGTPLWLIRRAARLAMRARPDVIALTGDFAADDAGTFAPVLDALACLEAPHGVWAVPGNHDYTVGIEKWHAELRRPPPPARPDQPRGAGEGGRGVALHRGGGRLHAGPPDAGRAAAAGGARFYPAAGARPRPGGKGAPRVRRGGPGRERAHARRAGAAAVRRRDQEPGGARGPVRGGAAAGGRGRRCTPRAGWGRCTCRSGCCAGRRWRSWSLRARRGRRYGDKLRNICAARSLQMCRRE